MGIEQAAVPESGGALRVPRARAVPLAAPLPSYAAAVERYLTAAGIAKSSARIYRISRTTWGMLRGEPAPTGPARRGARPAPFGLTAIDDPGLPPVLAAARADEMDADTVNRELSIVRKAIGRWQRQGWIVDDPTIGIERRPAPPDRTKALPKPQGGAVEWIHWQSGTTQLLPRLIADRTHGPLFLTDHKAPARTPTLDTCPVTGRARLSYRRAEEAYRRQGGRRQLRPSIEITGAEIRTIHGPTPHH
ncbi:hypothetical protein [Streptomyces catenulae]|uniref:Uncharacterized protein n=1 Tax=Streptomyces catenulae TaxID=66875 RepID=A0ABV2Z1W7_9ACTN|nr:hypothetical protein [Streptomyces catenulae]